MGLVGGLIAMVGAVLPWTLIQSCTGTLGFEFCISIPLPMTFGSIDPVLGVAAPLALGSALAGVGLLFAQQPLTGLISGVAGVLAMLMAIIFVINFSAAETEIISNLGGVSSSLRMSLSAGVYVTMAGGLILALGGFMQWSVLRKAGPEAATPPPA